GDQQGCIVFNVVGCYVPELNPEHYLAYLMACDGYKVKILMDDFQLEHWDYLLQTKSNDDYLWHKSLKNRILRGGHGLLSNLVFSHPGIEVINYSTILKEYPDDLLLTKSDTNHAESSVRKYFQAGAMDHSDPAQLEFYKVCLRNCQISKKVGYYIDAKIKPDLYVSSHGQYS